MKIAKKLIKFSFTIIFSVLILVLAVFYVYGNYDFPDSKIEKPIKGVRVGSLYSFIFKTSDLSKIKDAGFNAVLISPPVFIYGGRVFSPPFSFTATGFITRKAHLNGLNVIVMPEVIKLDKRKDYLNERLFKDYLLAYHQQLARFCEKAHVNYFVISPSAYRLPSENSIKWLEETCSECRVYYKGKIGFLIDDLFVKPDAKSYTIELLCLKGSLTGLEVGLNVPVVKGFDAVFFSSFPPPETRNLELYSVDFTNLQEKLQRISLRNGLGEPFYCGLNVALETAKYKKALAPVVTKEQRQIFLERMLKLAVKNGLNFIIWDWDSNAFSIKDDALLEDIRKQLRNGSSDNN